MSANVEYAAGEIYCHDTAGWRRDRTTIKIEGRVGEKKLLGQACT